MLTPTVLAAAKQARKRNLKRLNPEPLRYIKLHQREINTLLVAGRVEITRAIYKAIAHYRFCPYIQKGQQRSVPEDVKWFGASSKRAMYVYRDAPEWSTVDPNQWSELAALDAPEESRRFIVLAREVVREHTPSLWRVHLVLVKKGR